MDFRLSSEQERFRADLRGWLEANGPGDWGRIRSRLTTREAQAEFLIGWPRRLHAAGYVGLHGGTSEIMKNILAERMLGLPKD